MIYFTSDFHFGHKKIIKFERTQFKTIEEHDDFLLSLVENLHHEDTLYILGDFGELSVNKLVRFVRSKCRKIIVLGNHDDKNSECFKYFHEVHTKPVFFHNRILLSHAPLPVTNGTINLHGHLHNSYLDKPNYINCNIHMMDYKFISYKTIEKLMSKLQKDSYKFLKEWYVEDYKFTIEKEDVVVDADGKIDVEKSRLKRKEYLEQLTVDVGDDSD